MTEFEKRVIELLEGIHEAVKEGNEANEVMRNSMDMLEVHLRHIDDRVQRGRLG